jgi:iron complex transport system substrate-binding protein
MRRMRILSLLPSATEIVYALDLQDDLIGVTHECDWPPAAIAKRHVSFSNLEPASEPAEVDRQVSASVDGGDPIYRLDVDAVRELQPDLVLSQDLCRVCAVPSGHVNEALDRLGCTAEVLSLDPNTLDEVIECIIQVGAATGTEEKARRLVFHLNERLRAVVDAVQSLDRPRTFGLEWSDPPFNAGHWVPHMIDAAGGESVLGNPGARSERVTWDQIEQASPEVVVFMPCGYDLDAAVEEGRPLVDHPSLGGVERLFAVDATAYFSRPGPRLVDGVEILASLLHPRNVPEAPSGTAFRLK